MRLILQLAVIMAVGMPLAGQQIVQRMARDEVSEVAVPELASAPLLESAAIRQIAVVDSVGGDLTRAEKVSLRRVSEWLRRKNQDAAVKDWERMIGSIQARGVEPDVAELSAWVLHRVYLGQSPTLKSLADSVRIREEQRTAAQEAREQLERRKATLDADSDVSGLTLRPITLAEELSPGVSAVLVAEPIPATVESVAEELAKIVVLCSKADENAELAQVDLNTALQNQQQTLQTMSNVSKLLHDTAMAVIRKIG